MRTVFAIFFLTLATVGCGGDEEGDGVKFFDTGEECSPEWQDCDEIEKDECDADLATDPWNCGVCGNRCEDWENCIGGGCTLSPASQWDLVAVRGKVSTKTSNGSAWDALGGAPDPFVCVTVAGHKQCTSTQRDTFEPTWDEVLFQNIGAGSLQSGIRIEFVDEDLSNDDIICIESSTVSEASFKAKDFRVYCQDRSSHVQFRLFAR